MTIINGIEIDDINYIENDIKKAILNNDPIEDKLHVIIVISNPSNSAIRYILTREFIRRMKDEVNIILYIVELAYDNQEYHVTEKDNKNHLRLRTNHFPIWHKENLINIGVKKLLPVNWKAFAWIDADIDFDNPHWALDTLKILNGSRDIVQLFSNVLFMDKNMDTNTIFTGFAYQYVKKMKRETTFNNNYNSFWHPGFAWACTRKLYEKIGGLYEYIITGAGDTCMAECMLVNIKSIIEKTITDDYKKSLQNFEDKIAGCRIGYVPGMIRHYYHGTIDDRKYNLRDEALIKYEYSPTIHLTKDENGLLIPTELFPLELKNFLISYFPSRNEDIHLDKQINFNKILNLTYNCYLINLEKDTKRLESSINEFKKLSINTFKIIKATYWKNKDKFENDLNDIFTFLKKFNNHIPDKRITINEFSDINDENIKIQDAPLACYCSHLRAMIDAYSNSLDRAYSIIAEDDISIDNLTYIENYLNLIPNDWDIICFNAIPGVHSMGQNQVIPPDTIFYKFNCTLYHLHFYIIKNSCLEKIFQNIYPITDQVDILIGNMYNILNIYNITNTVTQKNFGTNIQNNLHVIYNTPVYKNLVNELDILDAVCLTYVSDKLKDNDQTINKNITNKIIDDVIFYNLFNHLDISQSNIINIQNKNTTLYEQLYKVVKYYIKDNSIDSYVLKLIDTIDYILDSFTLHNIYSEKYNNTYKAYSFGCTSSTYLINNIIVKVYNNKLRWTTNNHDNLDEIFKNELKILDKLNYLIDYDDKLKILTLKYMGESLYNNFELNTQRVSNRTSIKEEVELPLNWESQIVLEFIKLSENGIYYPEFNLNNIVVLDGKISFIDFGLAEIRENADNSNNSNIFIKLLNMLNDKFQNVTNTKQRHILYNKFMNNIRQNKLYILNVY